MGTGGGAETWTGNCCVIHIISVYESVCFVWIGLPREGLAADEWVGDGGDCRIQIQQHLKFFKHFTSCLPFSSLFLSSLSHWEGGGRITHREKGREYQFRYIVSYCSLSCVLVLVAWSLMCHHRHALKLHSYCGRYEQDRRNWTRASPYSPHLLPHSLTYICFENCPR